jgi:hypothetical protein
MDITEKKKQGSELRIFTTALKWGSSEIELLGTGSQAVQKYPSDFDFFSSIKSSSLDVKKMYAELQRILRRAQDTNEMTFIEAKVQRKDGEKQKFYEPWFSEEQFTKAVGDPAGLDFIKLDYVVFVRQDNELTELSIIYSFSGMPPLTDLVKKIKGDFESYNKEGKVYKSLKRMYSIYRLKGNKPKLVELSQLFNSETGKKYKASSNLKAIELLAEHRPDDRDVEKKIRVNLDDLGNQLGVKINTLAQVKAMSKKLDAQIEAETQEWLKSHKSVLP